MTRRHRGRTLILGLALTLAASSAWAQPAHGSEEPGSAWKVVTSLWHAITTSWPDVGCWIDPGGACGAAQAPAPDTEIGCWIDPHGACGNAQAPAPPPDTEIGCWIDPHGACGSGG
jgi:hypothetical protein